MLDDMDCNMLSIRYLFLKVTKNQKKLWHVIFFYYLCMSKSSFPFLEKGSVLITIV